MTASGLPTNVYTVLLVDNPGSTSNKLHPSVEAIALAMASITCTTKNCRSFKRNRKTALNSYRKFWHQKPRRRVTVSTVGHSLGIRVNRELVGESSYLQGVLQKKYLLTVPLLWLSFTFKQPFKPRGSLQNVIVSFKRASFCISERSFQHKYCKFKFYPQFQRILVHAYN